MPRKDFDPRTIAPDARPATKGPLFDPAVGDPWRGHLTGQRLGSATTVLAYGNDTPGEGPGLHVHPYDETFVVIAGRARFFVGDEVIDAEAGEVVLGPKGIPHRFINLGPGRLQTIDFHDGPAWLQTDIV